MGQTMAVAAVSASTTFLVTFLLNYILNHSKSFKEKRKEESRQFLKETVQECLMPTNKRLDSIEEGNSLLRKGIQSELRIELRDRYNYHINKGYAPTNIREDLENIYTAYHSLGNNGVMDDLRVKFLNLPLEKFKKGD